MKLGHAETFVLLGWLFWLIILFRDGLQCPFPISPYNNLPSSLQASQACCCVSRSSIPIRGFRGMEVRPLKAKGNLLSKQEIELPRGARIGVFVVRALDVRSATIFSGQTRCDCVGRQRGCEMEVRRRSVIFDRRSPFRTEVLTYAGRTDHGLVC